MTILDVTADRVCADSGVSLAGLVGDVPTFMSQVWR